MFILEILLQQKMAFQEVLGASWQQEAINLFSYKWHSNIILKDIKKFCKMFARTSLFSLSSLKNSEGKDLVLLLNHSN